MLKLAVALFAVAAMGGVTMATLYLMHKKLPWALVIGHGVFAAGGLVTLIIHILEGGATHFMAVDLGLFLLAAIGGFTLLSFFLRRKPLPVPLIAGHALFAVSGFVVLLVNLLKS